MDQTVTKTRFNSFMELWEQRLSSGVFVASIIWYDDVPSVGHFYRINATEVGFWFEHWKETEDFRELAVRNMNFSGADYIQLEDWIPSPCSCGAEELQIGFHAEACGR